MAQTFVALTPTVNATGPTGVVFQVNASHVVAVSRHDVEGHACLLLSDGRSFTTNDNADTLASTLSLTNVGLAYVAPGHVRAVRDDNGRTIVQLDGPHGLNTPWSVADVVAALS